MVTRGRDDWEQHKIDVKTELLKRFPVENVDMFMLHYNSRYNQFNRNLLDYKVAWALYDDYHYVKNNGTKYYAAVGPGGSGKTTIMKNAFYFLDDSFNMARIAFEHRKSVEIIDGLQNHQTLLLDEPDDDVSYQSLQGRKLRSMYGKMRFKKFHVGYCATNLMEIPSYIWKKLTGVFFLPYKGVGIFFKDEPMKKIYILDQIRKYYPDEGYNVFWRLARNGQNCIEFKTHRLSPLNPVEEAKYMQEKEDDFERTKREVKEAFGTEKGIPLKQPLDRELVIQRMSDKGYTKEQIGEVLGLSSPYIKELRGEMRRRGAVFGGGKIILPAHEMGENLEAEGHD